MKIVNFIKKKYFPYKVKLIKGELRTYLSELDKAFIYACYKLNLENNRLNWYHPNMEINWISSYTTNKYDFFKFNVKIQEKCWGTGHLKEFLHQMVIKLTSPKYWKPFFKLMDIFNGKSYGLGFEIYRYVKSTARVNSRIYGVLYCCLKESPSLTIMSWGTVYEWFCLFFNVDNNNSRTHSYNKNLM